MQPLAKEAADRLASEVRAAFLRGAARLDFKQADAEQMLSLGLKAQLSASWMPTTEARRRNEELMRRLGGNIGRWTTVYRGWAERGTRDDGTAYTWAKWEAYGREDLAPDVEKTTGLALSQELWTRFRREVVEQSATDLADVALPSRWPVGVQVLAGAAVLGVAAFVLRPYVVPFLPRSA